MTVDRDQLIEVITREVLAVLAGDAGECATCGGSCAAHTSEKVRAVVASGADRVSFNGNGADVPLDLARYIDHTLLHPNATAGDIDLLTTEALEFGFRAVCVNPVWVKRAATSLRGSDVRVASVIGFPFGATPGEIKATEARRVLRDGAREVDMVINIGALRSGDLNTVRADIAKVSDAAHEVGALNKVIIETAMLTDEEKVIASALARDAKADFVKTSTGYGGGGATVYDVALMRETVGPKMGVKASGGVRTKEDAEEMIAAGATRIGASASVQIVGGDEGGSSEQRY